MSRNVATIVPPVMALLLLVVIGVQTSDALKRSGAWAARAPRTATPPADPYGRLDTQLSRQGVPLPADGIRDPLTFGRAPATTGRRVPRPTVAPAPAGPLLTAIVADADPRAVIRYEDRYYTLKPGDLFARFRVISISADQVVLDGGGERIVLKRPTKGD